MQKEFPQTVSYNRLVELIQSSLMTKIMFAKTCCLGKCTRISFVDSTPLIASKNKRIKELRKVSLDNFSVEDLRLMIGQHESLEYLIPLAIEKLRADILSEGDMYKGDLLLAVVNARQDYWDKATEQKGELIELINKKKELIENEGLEIEID